jgi:ribosomal-protein-alanine N-acetyltransferase
VRPRTDRLTFGVWRDTDVALASALWKDPDVMRFLGGPYSDAQVRARLQREIDNDATDGVQYWPLFLAATGEHVGCCGLKPHDRAQRHFEIGFHLLPRFWGQGYASEAARAVMRWGFEELGATRLFAGHHPQNDASRTLLERLGFTCIGTHFFEPTGLQHPWYTTTTIP